MTCHVGSRYYREWGDWFGALLIKLEGERRLVYRGAGVL